MNGLTILFLILDVIIAAMIVWLNTKRGKKWLKDL